MLHQYRLQLAPIALISALCSTQVWGNTPAATAEVAQQQETPATTIEYTDNDYADNWGLGIGLRRTDIAFDVETPVVNDIMPLFFYEGEHVFLRGVEGGVHLWKQQGHEFNLYSRFRYLDIPKEYQNDIQESGYDFGFQYQYSHENWQADIALLSDTSKRAYGYTRAKYHWESGNWQLTPYAELKWKSSAFNDFYYGADVYDTGGGVAIAAGSEVRYHVASNLYLLGKVAVSRLEKNVVDLELIDRRYQVESFLGFGFFPDRNKPNSARIKKETGEYLRLAHGWATPSNLGDILAGDTESDPYNNQLTSLFYGYPVTQSLFNLPIDLYVTVGAGWHRESEVQNNLAEAILGFKAYYTFEFGPRWRLGVAEGLSYVSTIPYIEQTELDEKDFKPSQLLNYLDFSLDVNLGDIFNQHSLRNLWLGGSIHHRSGIFETSSAFGRIKGGSNVNMVYLQWHF